MSIMSKLKQWLKRWLDEYNPDYRKGKNVVEKANPLYVKALHQFINEGSTVEFPVKGWSMRIFVENERDKAVLSHCNKSDLKVGDVVLAEIDKDLYALHRIIKIDGEQLTLMGDGNLQNTESCTRSDVVAIVTAWRRKGSNKLDYVSGWKWRIYSKIWVPLLPVRRFLILAWRIKNRLRYGKTKVATNSPSPQV